MPFQQLAVTSGPVENVQMESLGGAGGDPFLQFPFLGYMMFGTMASSDNTSDGGGGGDSDSGMDIDMDFDAGSSTTATATTGADLRETQGQ
jgi:hypothetical protein